MSRSNARSVRLVLLLMSASFASSCLANETTGRICEEGAAAANDSNYERAMNIWAENSFDASARLRLKAVIDCLAYSNIASDDESAATWVLARANEGIVQAALYAGLLYGAGVGVDTDIDASLYWLDRAANKGSETAKFIGDGLRDHVRQAVDE